jgi:hypothetical protein
MQGKCKNCKRPIDETEYMDAEQSGLCLGCLLAAKEQWDADVARFNSNRGHGGISAQGRYNGPE